MSTETLPTWLWIIYYLFLFITLGTIIFTLILKRNVRISLVAIIIIITVPIMSLLNSIGRKEGLNEYEYLISQLSITTRFNVVHLYSFRLLVFNSLVVFIYILI